MTDTTELVFSQETHAPVTMAEIMAEQAAGRGALVTVGAEEAPDEDEGISPVKVGLIGATLAALGYFFSSRRKKGGKKSAA